MLCYTVLCMSDVAWGLTRTAWLHSKGAKFEGFETAVIENDITGALLLEQIKQDELVQQLATRISVAHHGASVDPS